MRTERIVALLALAGLIIKFLHFPGGMALMIVSIGVLCWIYFPFAFYFFSEKKLANQNIALTIPAGLIFSITLIGILFKLQYWSGHGYYALLFGLIASTALIVATYLLRINAVDDMAIYYKRMLRRSIAFFLLSALFFFTPSQTILLVQERDPELAHLKYMAYFHAENPDNRKRMDAYIRKRDSIKLWQITNDSAK